MFKEGVIFLVTALVLAHGLPQQYRRKLSRQEISAVAQDAVKQSLTPEAGAAADSATNTAPIAPVFTIIEGEVSSTPIPSGDDRKPPQPVIVLPGVNLTGFNVDQSAKPKPAFPERVSSTPAPTTTTVKPEEESDEEESEEEEELGGPVQFGEEENAEDDNTAEDEEDEEEQEDEEEARKNLKVKSKPLETKVTKTKTAEPKKQVAVAEKKSDTGRKNVRDQVRARVNSKAREEPFSLEISPDLHSFNQGGPPGKYDAFIPGYMTATGEVYVPLDTTDFQGPYTIVDDPSHQVDNYFGHGQPIGHGGHGGYGHGPPKKSYRKQVPQKAVAYDDDDDDESAEDETSSQEDDDDDEVVPVRLNSFNVIYDKKKPQEDEDESEEKAEFGPPGPPPPGYNNRPKRPTAQVVGGSPGSDPNANQAILINAAQGVKSQSGDKPSLAYVPARLPTGEDDEKDLARDPVQKNVPVPPRFNEAPPPSPPALSSEVSAEESPVPPPSSRADVFDFGLGSSEEVQPRSYYYPSYTYNYQPYEYWYH